MWDLHWATFRLYWTMIDCTVLHCFPMDHWSLNILSTLKFHFLLMMVVMLQERSCIWQVVFISYNPRQIISRHTCAKLAIVVISLPLLQTFGPPLPFLSNQCWPTAKPVTMDNVNIQYWIRGWGWGRHRISSPFSRPAYFVWVRVPINLFSIVGRFKTKTRCINLVQEMNSLHFFIIILTTKWSTETLFLIQIT